MTRHARNCTAGTVYTYHERKKDTSASGYGTQSQRVGKDSVKDFDCCCLTLQPCKNPVLTPQGYLYDKEAILEYILHQKCEIARRLKAYSKTEIKISVRDGRVSKSGAGIENRTARYVCPVTNDVLGNSVPCAVLKTSGNVVTMECVEKIIKKDMVDPTCGKPLTDKDIIPLKRGATGFSGTSSNLIASKAGPSLQA
ncbi:hypothetical protein C0Q70_05463 [Pomacea canaliculata]|uniref:Nitric oxide synthase-interacting protein zinc-finger domain-containing protein n=1 Tax=Pomacea canaliculata TaxID=400727 RepID=A0A2T7PLD5_POMCA|nr:hypothetical protein C0Q70_05463 [Pomacea canaliculata]